MAKDTELPLGSATVPPGFILNVGPTVHCRSVFGIPVELSFTAAKDFIVMHPDTWVEFMTNALKLTKIEPPKF